MKIVCIIPSACSQKTLPYIRRCIHSLIQAAGCNVQLVICVVSSNPDARKLLLGSSIDHSYLVDRSCGFAQMNNIAIKETMRWLKSDYYLFINDDAWVKPNFFSVFRTLVSQLRADIISPIIYQADNKSLDSFGIEYFRSGYAKNSLSPEIKTSLATGACLLVKTSFLARMSSAYGFHLNPILHYYLEDVEFSIRAAAIGATFIKSPLLIAHHVGSVTSGKRSYFTMYHTYRNILWVIILTWPRSVIAANAGSILLVMGWSMLYSLKLGPLLYPSLLVDTMRHFRRLAAERRRIIRAYKPSFCFTDILSPHAFRTYHGITI